MDRRSVRITAPEQRHLPGETTMTTYTVHAGDHSTDLGMVGRCGSLRTVRDADGQDVERGERTLRTGYRWMVRA